jgi:hypothetical protein
MIPEHLRFSCPYPACGALLQLEEQVSDLPSECPSCQRAVCSSCRSPWHAGLVSGFGGQAFAYHSLWFTGAASGCMSMSHGTAD